MRVPGSIGRARVAVSAAVVLAAIAASCRANGYTPAQVGVGLANSRDCACARETTSAHALDGRDLAGGDLALVLPLVGEHAGQMVGARRAVVVDDEVGDAAIAVVGGEHHGVPVPRP